MTWVVSDLMIIALCFVLINITIVWLATTDMFQGWKTKVTAFVLGTAAIVQGALPDTLGQYVTADTMSWVYLGLSVTILVARSVSRR